MQSPSHPSSQCDEDNFVALNTACHDLIKPMDLMCSRIHESIHIGCQMLDACGLANHPVNRQRNGPTRLAVHMLIQPILLVEIGHMQCCITHINSGGVTPGGWL